MRAYYFDRVEATMGSELHKWMARRKPYVEYWWIL